jgi:hypothetical protein
VNLTLELKPDQLELSSATVRGSLRALNLAVDVLRSMMFGGHTSLLVKPPTKGVPMSPEPVRRANLAAIACVKGFKTPVRPGKRLILGLNQSFETPQAWRTPRRARLPTYIAATSDTQGLSAPRTPSRTATVRAGASVSSS